MLPPIDPALVRQWEFTPQQALAGHTIWIPPASARESGLRSETRGFDSSVPKKPVEGTRFTAQVGVSSNSLAIDMRAISDGAPGLPNPAQLLGRDRRSGVFLYDGDKLIAHYIILGFSTESGHVVWVDPEYRGDHLGATMLFEWYKAIPRPRKYHSVQRMNPNGLRVFLAGRPKIFRWAIDQGYALPDRVLRELDTGAEAAAIRAKLDRVLETRKPLTI